MSIVVKKKHIAAAISDRFSPLPACIRLPPKPPSTTTLNLPSTTSTSVYATDFGPCVLTWTRTLLGRTLRIHLEAHKVDLTLKIRSKPLLFSRSHGSKTTPFQAQIFYDFRHCKLGPETEPDSNFYLLVLISGEIALLLGDLVKPALSKVKLGSGHPKPTQRLVSRKEHVHGSRFYRASVTRPGGKKMRFLVEHDCSGPDPVLRVSVNGFRVLEVEHLVWKFRGNEQMEVEGISVNISWDVHGWLFKSKKKDKDGGESGSGVFMFGFEEEREVVDFRERMAMMMNGGNTTTSNGSSVSSLSGSSWGSSSSVRDWWSSEEREMEGGNGFSLVVYAWKS